jgi:hypothetical protein
MKLFNNSNSSNLITLKEIPFKLEKEIQNIFAKNLQNIMSVV